MNNQPQPPKRRKAKRDAGAGHIRQRPSGLFECEVMLGYREDGKRDRRTVTGKTRKEVNEKVAALQQQRRAGTLAGRDRLTLGEFLERWLRDSVASSVRPRTYESYAQ